MAERWEPGRLEAGRDMNGSDMNGSDMSDRQHTDVFPEHMSPGGAGARQRSVDPVSLIAGLVFSVLAVLVLIGVDLPAGPFWDGGLGWVVLIGAGIALLVTELRRARRRR